MRQRGIVKAIADEIMKNIKYCCDTNIFKNNLYLRVSAGCGLTKAVTGGVLYKKLFLKILQYPQCLYWSIFLIMLQGLGTFLKKTPTQVLSSEIWETKKKIYFEEHQRMAASGFLKKGDFSFSKFVNKYPRVFL